MRARVTRMDRSRPVLMLTTITLRWYQCYRRYHSRGGGLDDGFEARAVLVARGAGERAGRAGHVGVLRAVARRAGAAGSAVAHSRGARDDERAGRRTVVAPKKVG